MEDNQWHVPLLLTDVSSNYMCSIDPNSNESQEMRHSEGSGLVHKSLEMISPQRFSDLIKGDISNGQSMLGFSLTSPDLVVCAGSPDISKQTSVFSAECFERESRKEKEASIVLSLEEGINGVEVEASRDMCGSSNFSSFWQSPEGEEEVSGLELDSRVTSDGKISNEIGPIISINVGSEDTETMLGSTSFAADKCFSGGDVVRTVADIEGGEGSLMYQTARLGDFSYKFGFLEVGKYVVDLHFAEIVITDGPPGMRVFDVFIQDKKVVSGLDIYERVGANRSLVIGNLEAAVENNEGLTIKLKGINGNPIMSGISVRKDLSKSACGEDELLEVTGTTKLSEGQTPKHVDKPEVIGDFNMLQRDYELQKQELLEARKAIEELKRENQVTSNECQQAWKSLRELQNELMRKSMHVGSLAFAIEGQVKEKSKWFSCLSDLRRKLKILKLEHIQLSEEALNCKNFLRDLEEMRSMIQAKMTQQVAFHDELKMKITVGEKEKKELYNKVLELKGNIRVFCRCRPLNAEEVAMGAKVTVDFVSARDGEITVKSNGLPKKTFKFDAVFGPQADQADVFEDTAPFATSVLDGYNVCIFAYGQTGTGKTFTMEGMEDARGVNYRTLAEIFRIIGERRKLFRYEISVSVLEVYSEQIRDLLASGTQQPGMASKR